jgi:SAM-dependent methyltransferase
VTVQPGEGESLPFADETFDGVFICWLLEHALDPHKVLAEAYRVLKTGGIIYVTEVANDSLITLPRLPYLHAYFAKVNRLQISSGGSPNFGLKAPATMANLGFQSLKVTPLPILFDSRIKSKEERKAFIGYWVTLLQSMEGELLKQGYVTPWMITRMQEELHSMVFHKPQIFCMTPIQVFGKK